MANWESIFPTPIMRSNLGRAFTPEERRFFVDCKSKARSNVTNLRSADTHVLDAPEMQSLRSEVQDRINEFAWKVFSADPRFEFFITQSWLNYTKPGQSHHRHMHTNSLVSGVLYINVASEIDSICFHRQSASQIQILVSSDQLSPYNTPVVSYAVDVGDLILFPSNVIHSVEQETGNHTRISLAFNAFVRGELGSEERLNKLKI